MEPSEINWKEIIKYASITWGLIASGILTKQQLHLLKKRNEITKAYLDILRSFNINNGITRL